LNCLYTKVKEGSGQEKSDLLEEGRILVKIKEARGQTAAACLGELTIIGKRS